jgi:ribose/xylose/arabinose/galactoside ABC-type transport system permease subunit
MAAGLAEVLVMREFDLSLGAVAGACGALAVVGMSRHDLPAAVAVAAALGLGTAIGAVNGVLISSVGIPSFVTTLAMGSLVGGLELAIANTTIFSGIKPGYLELTKLRPLGVPLAVILVAAIGTGLAVLLRHTVFGRHATALGDNPAAARIAGVPVARTHIAGFALAGFCAGLAGILLTSRAASYYPGPGAGLLLPAYAAVFLSLSLGRGWRFNVGGTALGAVFLGTITTGLTMLNQKPWVAAVVQGLVLLAAVVALARRRASA